MVKELPGCFEYLIQSHFPGAGILEVEYIFEAFLICNQIYSDYQARKIEHDRVVKDAENQIRKQKRGART